MLMGLPSSIQTPTQHEGGPVADRQLVTFLARPGKVTQRRPPLESRPVFTGCPCAACPGRRLRNSTWRGAHNAPHCGTDSVPGGRKLGRNPSYGRLV